MNPIEPYIPIDRRLALANHVALPERSNGAALFVDISGFTPLTGALVRHFGPRRGVEELTKWLNRVYSALIAQIEQYQGSVIGFSGDAITCWFAANDEALDGATERATIAALAAQEAMTQFRALRVDHSSRTADEAPAFALAVKTAIAAGTVRRFAVGVPSIQLIDVLAGTTLDRMAATEAMANQNELLIDELTLRPIQSHLTIAEWRADLATGLRYAKVTGSNLTLAPQPWPSCPPLPEEQTQSWILPPIAERLKGQQSRFLAELRPAAALFLRFTGLDFDQDPDAPHKLDSYIQWVQKIIDQHEGALIQLTTGDKGSYLYATFGAPIAHDDDIQRAVAAAIVLRQPPPHFAFINTTQIGITYGMMRVGAYGGETRKTYGVLGTETNMAARLMSHAAPGQIVVSSNVAEVISERYELSDLGLHKLKGKAEAQPLFAVQGLRQHPDPGATLYTAQLVGRESELRQLTTFAQLVDAQHGKLVRIEGGAGLGKSHLVAHFAQEAER
ncbi:MAG: adenylate/guanylate cyclase domain-containing protein, partial [Caldilineaceae bacterium]|nr:adenylate/guanylate cyclase domain-containing protein [Caldilineaceae bacterium]